MKRAPQCSDAMAFLVDLDWIGRFALPVVSCVRMVGFFAHRQWHSFLVVATRHPGDENHGVGGPAPHGPSRQRGDVALAIAPGPALAAGDWPGAQFGPIAIRQGCATGNIRLAGREEVFEGRLQIRVLRLPRPQRRR